MLSRILILYLLKTTSTRRQRDTTGHNTHNIFKSYDTLTFFLSFFLSSVKLIHSLHFPLTGCECDKDFENPKPEIIVFNCGYFLDKFLQHAAAKGLIPKISLGC